MIWRNIFWWERISTFFTLWKTRNSLLRKFFPVKSIVIDKFFSKTLIWRKFCERTEAAKFRNFHNVQFFSDFFRFLVKTLFSRNFCQNNVTLNFCNFHTSTMRHFLKNVLKDATILNKQKSIKSTFLKHQSTLISRNIKENLQIFIFSV